MNKDISPLFQPFSIGHLELKNKIASGREKEINPCIDCRGCVTRVAVSHKPLICSVNPQLGKEA